MTRTRSLGLVLGLCTALALVGCGDDMSGPLSSSDNNGNNDNARRSGGGGGTGLVTVVHGVPGLTVDVYVNGGLTLPDFVPGTVTDPLELPEGDYDLAIVPAGGDFPDDIAISGSTFLPAGANASIVAYLQEGGTPALKVFVNDTSPTRGIRTRVVVRHLADAPTVDVRLFRKWFRWWPVRTIRGLSNMEEAQTDLWPGRLSAKIYPAGSYSPVFSTPRAALYPNESTIVYAIGSLGGGTFDVLVQKIDLPRAWRSAGDRDSADPAIGVADDLSLEEYDRMAVDLGVDLEADTLDPR